MLIKEILKLSSRLPTGLDDPASFTKLNNEMEELYKALVQADQVGAVLEAADCVYYAIKAEWNDLISQEQRDEITVFVSQQVGLPPNLILRTVIAKYNFRVQNNLKDDIREREIISRLLADQANQVSEEYSTLAKSKRFLGIVPDLVFGSERFLQGEKQNRNSIFLAPIIQPMKIVINKDVCLLIPSDVRLLGWEAYPSHQESWLPLWYIIIYHAIGITDRGKKYRKELFQITKSYDRDVLRSSLCFKGYQFLNQFKERVYSDSANKLYKNLTRILQDIVLYLDLPIELIEDHDNYLSQHPIAPLVEKARAMRKGLYYKEADIIYEACRQQLALYVNNSANLSDEYYSMLSRFSYNGDIFVFKRNDPRVIQFLMQSSSFYSIAPMQLKIFVAGEPNSGKSVFVYLLHRALCEMGCQVHLLRAAPDGEQVWVQETDESIRSVYRQKGDFTIFFAKQLSRIIHTYNGTILLVDAGGKMSLENETIAETCNSAIVVTRNNLSNWLEWIARKELTILATLRSRVQGVSSITKEGDRITGFIAGLQRGSAKPNHAVQQLAEMIRNRAGVLKFESKDLFYAVHRVHDFTAVTVLKSVWDITPNQINWNEIPQLTTDCVIIDGEVPCWIILLLVLHYKTAGCRWIGVSDHRLETTDDTVIIFSRDPLVNVGSSLNSKQFNYAINYTPKHSGAIQVKATGNSYIRKIEISRQVGAMPTPQDCSLIDEHFRAETVLITGSVPCWLHARAAAISLTKCGIFNPRTQDYILVHPSR